MCNDSHSETMKPSMNYTAKTNTVETGVGGVVALLFVLKLSRFKVIRKCFIISGMIGLLLS